MCGIFGTTLQYEAHTITRKLELMRFRGPDNTGIEVYDCPPPQKDCNGLTLGHLRLSVIDLDTRSNQPFNHNGHLAIVFNGEVYNYRELKAQYLSDVRFRTESDTEVICAMYERFGTACVKYLNGMFAFVIYDRRKNLLFGARDRLGIKPFYYWHSKDGFEFASQPKAIQHGNNFHIDAFSRQLYLLNGYYPDPYTPFEEVRKLMPGECFTYKLDTKQLDISPYWDLHVNSCGFTKPKSYEEAKETVRELLTDAVRLRLNANVPVGMFLSGGIDSSLVCALVARLNKDLCAYTVKFPNSEKDESEHAVAVARSLDVPIKVFPCTGNDLSRVFYDYTDYYDEPFADDSLIPSCLVAEKARQDVTVILGGDGGDELFYGYPKYEWTWARLQQYRKPYWLRKMLSPYFLLKRGKLDMLHATQRDYADVYRSLGTFVYDMGGTERFDRMALGRKQPFMECFQRGRGILGYCDYDMKCFMLGVLQKTDRATMRASLELRSPILDYRIAEYSRLLPYEYLTGGGLGLKRILKDILYEMVPREILERPKQGFVPPIGDWFRGDLKEELLSTVSQEAVSELLPELDASKFVKLRDEFVGGKGNNTRMFFSVYTYIRWYRQYMGNFNHTT